MCIAQGPQRNDTDEAQTHDPSVWSQALYFLANALPNGDDDGESQLRAKIESMEWHQKEFEEKNAKY